MAREEDGEVRRKEDGEVARARARGEPSHGVCMQEGSWLCLGPALKLMV